jgi:TetR/AcrR family transcriptional regulator
MAGSIAAADASDTRERILEAALQAFAEKGFDGATTRDIAARAGVNLGLIKYYFDAKLKLWQAAVERAFASLSTALGNPADRDSLFDERERIEVMIRRFVRFVAAHPEFVRIMHDEGKRKGPRTRWLVDRYIRPYYQETVRIFESAQQRGWLPSHIDPIHFHYILIGAVGIIFHQAEECRRLTGIDPTDQAVIEAHADAVIHLLLPPEATP